MPFSSIAGKAWIQQRLDAAGPVKRVLDVGVGAGGYADLFRARLPGSDWIGIEVWGPYIEAFKLEDKYDLLIVGDARWLDLPRLGRFDLVFMGDVLEHMPELDAQFVVAQLLKQTRLMFISAPIGHAPQEAVYGNPFEEHVVDDYSEARLRAAFPSIVDGHVEADENWRIGVFALTTDPEVAARLQARAL